MKMLSLLPVLAIVLIAGCIGQTAGTQPAAPYKIGLDFPMSGPLAVYGTNFEPPARLAVGEINAAGGINGRQLELIIEDNQGDPKQAATAATKLLSVDNVDVIVTITTPLSGPVAPIAEASKKLMVYGSAVNSFAEKNRYVFKDYGDGRTMCRMLVNASLQTNKTRIALFGINSEFTQECKDAADAAFPGAIVSYETFNAGETDFRTQLAKIKEAAPDSIILSSFSSTCVGVWKQVAEAGLQGLFLLPYTKVGCGEENAVAAANRSVDGALGVDFLVDANNPTPKLKAFLDSFNARYGKNPHFITEGSMVYDQIYMFKSALEQCPDAGSDCMVEALERIRFTGASGDVYFTPTHITVRPMHLIVFRNGKWVDYP
jgi:branched-chain amino acid transport system substrate-binding protein